MRPIVFFPTLLLLLAAICSGPATRAADPWLEFPPADGPGNGKHIVLISGDEEYRSEEALPLLAQVLAEHHGFRCTVLFAINPEDGTVNPDEQTNIPGMEKLADADMVVLGLRFRELPDEDMRYFDEYVNSGKPVLGLRTSTHAFDYKRNSDSPYAHYSWASKTWPGGFGQQVLGETWINHHGRHGQQATRGIINWQLRNHPILRGVQDVFGPTDVYGVEHVGPDADVLMFGIVLDGMDPQDQAVNSEKNNPPMPLVWTRTYTGRSGKPSRVICTTMGAAADLQSEGLRRLLVNACYWGMGLEDAITADRSVSIPESYDPTFFGFGGYRKGLKPEAFRP